MEALKAAYNEIKDSDDIGATAEKYANKLLEQLKEFNELSEEEKVAKFGSVINLYKSKRNEIIYAYVKLIVADLVILIVLGE